MLSATHAGSAVAVSVVELVGVSLIIRRRHRVARSMLGRQAMDACMGTRLAIAGLPAPLLSRRVSAATVLQLFAGQNKAVSSWLAPPFCRLYGFAYDVFSSIQGVVAMALQRNFTGACWGGWTAPCRSSMPCSNRQQQPQLARAPREQ